MPFLLRAPSRKWLIAALLALVAAALVWLFWPSNDGKPVDLTAPVTQGELEDTVLATGTLRAARMINVGAQATGQVKALHVKVGDKVQQGQLIAEIDATTQTNALRDDMASLASMQSQRDARLAALKLAQINLERQQQMYARQATSQSEVQQAENALAAAQADVKANQMQLQQAQIKIETSKANLGYTRIVAPMTGTVVAVVTEQGQTVNASTATPTIVKLAQLDPMQIEAQISEADVARVKPGMAAYFTLMGEPDTRYPTKLHAIDLVPTDQTRENSGSSPQGAVYYNGVLMADNPQGKLRVSMTAQVFIVAARADNALRVPSAALGARLADGRYEVKVVNPDDAKAEPQTRPVRIGLNNRVHAQVLEGLTLGQKVVIGKAKTAAEMQAEGVLGADASATSE